MQLWVAPPIISILGSLADLAAQYNPPKRNEEEKEKENEEGKAEGKVDEGQAEEKEGNETGRKGEKNRERSGDENVDIRQMLAALDLAADLEGIQNEERKE